jgi:hypothetical protein
MAKITGGLFSLSASGKFAKALVFASTRGTQYVRQLVIPANPRSLNQEITRSNMRVAASSVRWTGLQTVLRPGETLMDKASIMLKSIGALAWNTTLVKAMIGEGSIAYDADEASFQALTAPQKTAWDAAAAALTPPIMAVSQTTTGGVAIANATAGKVYFHHVAALWRLAITTQPGAAPPT